MKVLSHCFAELGRWVGWFVRVFSPAEQIRMSNLQPEQGTVMRLDGDAVAVYKQSTGTLLVFSAQCPDGSGLLSWSENEKLWICSCHNNAFSPDGQPLFEEQVLPLQRIGNQLQLRSKHQKYYQ